MTVMTREFTVPGRFCGPPGVANGGWISGTVASFLEPDRTVEVTLRRPTPLDAPIRVEREQGTVRLSSQEGVLVEARHRDGEPDAPKFVPLETAIDAARAFPGHVTHPFPGCFVCGRRAPGEGLRIFPGVTGERGVVAAPFFADHRLAEFADTLPLSHVWGALDCPSGWAHLAEGGVAVLGRLRARVYRSVFAGETYVAVGAATGRDGRKLHAGSALYRADGTLVAAAEATWIEI